MPAAVSTYHPNVKGSLAPRTTDTLLQPGPRHPQLKVKALAAHPHSPMSPHCCWGLGRHLTPLSLFPKNRFPSQMASLWILPRHLVSPTAHSRREAVWSPCRTRAPAPGRSSHSAPLLAQPPCLQDLKPGLPEPLAHSRRLHKC